MTDDRKSGIALIAGSLGGMVTMMIHPTAGGPMTVDQVEHLADCVREETDSPIQVIGQVAEFGDGVEAERLAEASGVRDQKRSKAKSNSSIKAGALQGERFRAAGVERFRHPARRKGANSGSNHGP